jgi:DNA replication protein DnaC
MTAHNLRAFSAATARVTSEDRYDKKSTLITSLLPVDQWHAYINEPTLADAILDRLVHSSHRLVLKGGSMRKFKRDAAASS